MIPGLLLGMALGFAVVPAWRFAHPHTMVTDVQWTRTVLLTWAALTCGLSALAAAVTEAVCR